MFWLITSVTLGNSFVEYTQEKFHPSGEIGLPRSSWFAPIVYKLSFCWQREVL